MRWPMLLSATRFFLLSEPEMAVLLLSLQQRYPGAHAWAPGDSPALADELTARVLNDVKQATCCSAAYQQGSSPAVPGSHHIILNGAGAPVCCCDVTPQQAALEGEGGLSVAWWRDVHQTFFTHAHTFGLEMMLGMKTFALVEKVV